ncbi:MAG: CPBP family intramembrane metalloprotease [Eubacteriaceae bacterium]|nr:CPBP family intramembrane metalloprotease [Eubacteriaceae bacterium]
MKKIISKFLPAIRFTLFLLPVSAVAGYFTGIYSLTIAGEEVLNEALAVFGSESALVMITTLQTVLYTVFCGIFGYILSEKLGLIKPFEIKWESLKRVLAFSLVGGIILSMDHWVFGHFEPMIKTINASSLNFNYLMTSVLYGGIIEELMLRFFFMSLTAFVIKIIFFRKRDAVPKKVFLTANIISSIAFAAGHLPSTALLFGSITPMLLFRCFLLNGGFGFMFGYFYEKYGIQYSMISHAALHIISKTIWFIFI